jgi:hypothetical protein
LRSRRKDRGHARLHVRKPLRHPTDALRAEARQLQATISTAGGPAKHFPGSCNGCAGDAARSFVETQPTAPSDQNLPAAFQHAGRCASAPGVAIGDHVLDLAVLEEPACSPYAGGQAGVRSASSTRSSRSALAARLAAVANRELLRR